MSDIVAELSAPALTRGMVLTAFLLIGVGLALLYFGADWLISGGVSLALRLGLTPVVVGLTVVAYGTSMPEMVVSTKAAMSDAGAIAVGNVVGSNIFNIAVILGLAAIFCPIRIQFQLIRWDAPIMLAATLLFLWFFRDSRIERWEAGVLLTLIILYTVGNVWGARRATGPEVAAEYAEGVSKTYRHVGVEVAWIVGGLLALVAGARLLVDNAVILARHWGMTEAMIGLTIVAAGTSLPELAATIVAALKKQPDIAVGNVIGSNIFNVLAILGVAGLVAPLDGAGISRLDLSVMLGVSAILLPMLWTGRQVSRWEGGLLLSLYLGYLIYLWPKS